MDENFRYVFILGLHRSGTSMLHRILAAQDGFTGFQNTGVPEDEGQHLQFVMSKAYELGGAGLFGFHKDAHIDEHSPLNNPLDKERLVKSWEEHWDDISRTRLEKSPPHLLRSRFLQAVFPNSYFICITRHPMAVSLATAKWSKTSILELMEHWFRCYDLFTEDEPKLNRVMRLRYEDLVSEPEENLSRLSTFLGNEVHMPEGIQLRPEVNERYFQHWRRRWNVERWRSETKIRQRYESRLHDYGYQWPEGM